MSERLDKPFQTKCATCGHAELMHCPEEGHGSEGSCGCFWVTNDKDDDWTDCPCERFSE